MDQAEITECTGLAATWCPIHGDCTCHIHNEIPQDESQGAVSQRNWDSDMDDPNCPLHSPTSDHAERPARYLILDLEKIPFTRGRSPQSDSADWERWTTHRCPRMYQHALPPEDYGYLPQPCNECYAIEHFTHHVDWSALGRERG
jgi:hypothetical protein